MDKITLVAILTDYEEYIKNVAQEEYSKGNIIEKCYNSMINYEVEITD